MIAWSRVLLAFGLGVGVGACFNAPRPAVQFSCDPVDAPQCPPDYACEADGCCHLVGSDVAEHEGECQLGGALPTGGGPSTSSGSGSGSTGEASSSGPGDSGTSAATSATDGSGTTAASSSETGDSGASASSSTGGSGSTGGSSGSTG